MVRSTGSTATYGWPEKRSSVSVSSTFPFSYERIIFKYEIRRKITMRFRYFKIKMVIELKSWQRYWWQQFCWQAWMIVPNQIILLVRMSTRFWYDIIWFGSWYEVNWSGPWFVILVRDSVVRSVWHGLRVQTPCPDSWSVISELEGNDSVRIDKYDGDSSKMLHMVTKNRWKMFQAACCKLLQPVASCCILLQPIASSNQLQAAVISLAASLVNNATSQKTFPDLVCIISVFCI